VVLDLRALQALKLLAVRDLLGVHLFPVRRAVLRDPEGLGVLEKGGIG
jgi:hypothetical protein